MITIKDLKEHGYKEYSEERIISAGYKQLFQKRVRDENTGDTQYFINAWVYTHEDNSQNIEFELCSETICTFWCRYLIYGLADFNTIEEVEKSIHQHWEVDGALYGE